jgi:hypothetical protein
MPNDNVLLPDMSNLKKTKVINEISRAYEGKELKVTLGILKLIKNLVYLMGTCPHWLRFE